MSLHKLHLFTKDTNASATEQGFQYQKLVTLKTWIENRINSVDEVIYCDYEEDIFQKNIAEGKSKFRQVKLYSSKFSFSREEIQKSLAHFFMLFVKGEYKFDEVSFVFETNSGIAKEVRGNDADLLRQWAASQNAMSEDLHLRCRERVKAIINEYIGKTYQQQVTTDHKALLQQAKNVYDQLPDEAWDVFIGSIKWKFEAIPQQEAIPKLLEQIEKLIISLPLAIKADKVSTYVAVLHYEIAARTAKTREEDRMLTGQLLDVLLLNEGSEQEKWYVGVFQKWREIKTIERFHVGAFYEVIDAARCCRWEMRGSNHATIWLDLLQQYIKLNETLIVCRRKAIYEYVCLKATPHPEMNLPMGGIEDLADWIIYYFSEFEHRFSFSAIEEDIVLLDIAQVQQLLSGAFLDQEKLTNWAKMIEQTIDNTIASSDCSDILCQAYELKGHLVFNGIPVDPLNVRIRLALKNYRKIIELLDESSVYSITRLSEELTKMLEAIIVYGSDEDETEPIEDFLTEIEEYAIKTGQRNDIAKNFVQRGTVYLEKPSAKNYLKALDCFHRAKDNWALLETSEGYILALINIAQVYSALGMNLAAKYYALCGVWASTRLGNYTDLEKISDSYAMAFDADFCQGAWMSTLDDFDRFIVSRIEFSPKHIDVVNDSEIREVFEKVGLVLAVGPVMLPELTTFVEQYKARFGTLIVNCLQQVMGMLESRVIKREWLDQALPQILLDVPFNDLGTAREINFSALGIKWKICFKNTAELNAIAEEFCSLLQITLCEICLLGADLHLIELPVKINIIQAEKHLSSLRQEAPPIGATWEIAIPAFNKMEQSVSNHYAALSANIMLLLNQLSLLPKEEFERKFIELYDKQRMGDKGLATTAYQETYFNLLTRDDFKKSMRENFNSTFGNIYDIKRSGYLSVNDGLSPKYNREKVLELVSSSYKNSLERLSITLPLWKEQPQFRKIVHLLRNEGYLDWQILVVLTNFVLTFKAQQSLPSYRYKTVDELVSAIDVEFDKLLKLHESECYIEIPADLLNATVLYGHVRNWPLYILPSLGLQNKMKYPDVSAVYSFLKKRFNIGIDDVLQESPLNDI
jgi:hypothetical protein